ncbi:hypothetical protein V8C86DRAFT_2575142 [Haematococcus lacustris]
MLHAEEINYELQLLSKATMNRVHVVRKLSELSKELSSELDSLADRAFALNKEVQGLEAENNKVFSDKAVQADTSGGAGAAQYQLSRARRLAPFSFQPATHRAINWKLIRAINVDQLVQETDVHTLMSLFDDLAHADFESESAFNLTEASLLKLLQLSQLLMQYLQWTTEQSNQQQQLLTEDRAALGAALHTIPGLSLKQVSAGLNHLGQEFAAVGNTDLDAMFLKVRAQERQGRPDVHQGAAPDQAPQQRPLNSQQWQELNSHMESDPPMPPRSTSGQGVGRQHSTPHWVQGDGSRPPCEEGCAVPSSRGQTPAGTAAATAAAGQWVGHSPGPVSALQQALLAVPGYTSNTATPEMAARVGAAQGATALSARLGPGAQHASQDHASSSAQGTKEPSGLAAAYAAYEAQQIHLRRMVGAVAEQQGGRGVGSIPIPTYQQDRGVLGAEQQLKVSQTAILSEWHPSLFNGGHVQAGATVQQPYHVMQRQDEKKGSVRL